MMKKTLLLCSALLLFVSCSRTTTSSQEQITTESSDVTTKTSAKIRVFDKSGKPLSGITVLFIKRENPRDLQSNFEILEKTKTDANGDAYFDLTKYNAYEGNEFSFIAGKYVNNKFVYPSTEYEPNMKLEKNSLFSSSIELPNNF